MKPAARQGIDPNSDPDLQLAPNEKDRTRVVFHMMDVDQDGTIDVHEMCIVNESDMEAMIQILDADGNSQVQERLLRQNRTLFPIRSTLENGSTICISKNKRREGRSNAKTLCFSIADLLVGEGQVWFLLELPRTRSPQKLAQDRQTKGKGTT